jgi:hypothetical protein
MPPAGAPRFARRNPLAVTCTGRWLAADAVTWHIVASLGSVTSVVAPEIAASTRPDAGLSPIARQLQSSLPLVIAVPDLSTTCTCNTVTSSLGRAAGACCTCAVAAVLTSALGIGNSSALFARSLFVLAACDGATIVAASSCAALKCIHAIAPAITAASASARAMLACVDDRAMRAVDRDSCGDGWPCRARSCDQAIMSWCPRQRKQLDADGQERMKGCRLTPPGTPRAASATFRC